jgi:hypothetical protein
METHQRPATMIEVTARKLWWLTDVSIADTTGAGTSFSILATLNAWWTTPERSIAATGQRSANGH